MYVKIKYMEKIDFLSIGDVINDTFIELEDGHVVCDATGKKCMIGLTLGDKIPYKNAQVIHGAGNAGNAAVSASRLGLHSAILTITGNDEAGDRMLDHFSEEKVSQIFIKKDTELPTNNAYILESHPDRTILVKHEAYQYVVPTGLLNANKPGWIYFTSIGKNSLNFHHELIKWTQNNPETKLAFQPGTFQIELGINELSDVYKTTEIFFCNVEEAQKILKEESRDVKILLEKMALLGPKTVIITDGVNGAYTFNTRLEEKWFMPIYPHKPFENTGAGDAFASTIVSALALGKTLEETLLWGPVNSQSVVQHIGSQKGLLTQEQLQEFLAKAPENYKPVRI